jgi:hypothetical protein
MSFSEFKRNRQKSAIRFEIDRGIKIKEVPIKRKIRDENLVFELFKLIQKQIDKYHSTRESYSLLKSKTGLRFDVRRELKNLKPSFAMELDKSGQARICAEKGKNLIKIEQHVGNVDMLNKFIETIKQELADNTKTEAEIDKLTIKLDNLEGYAALLKYCLENADKPSENVQLADFGFFRVNIIIIIINSSLLFSVLLLKKK